MRTPATLVTIGLLTCAVAQPAAAAPPKGACSNPEPGRPVIKQLPWAQDLLGVERVWPQTNGARVTVAVVDSGVDADNPQLRGRVLAGQDFHHHGKLPGSYDCVSHGTSVAGIIAATPTSGIGFHGIAPGATILPVRVTDREANEGEAARTIDPNVLARGIVYAVDQGARVINLSLSGSADRKVIREAIAYAVGSDVVVVAAAGNRQTNGADSTPSYPAEYPGVLGVGAIGIDGARVNGSQTGSYVDIVAPGGDVLSTTRVSGHNYMSGTSFAAPFVSATAALVRSAWPELTAEQVIQRIEATASPARGGRASNEYGAGVVDPYRAVTEGMLAKGAVIPAAAATPPDPQVVVARAWWRDAGSRARELTGLSLGMATIVLILAIVLAAGRRRRWTASRAETAPRTRRRTEEPLPEHLFDRSL
ncbi:type VII secretion-associated serine protease mycosin [Kribbella antibiotica]|uniref:Type VII secretion-associated serine protease mycosin n=1 Tax=Kribbella antibiotica TaxID=190195 RepID=A0A4V2YQF7_9ACTN|nr:type VII secretion-associated serine protease mycosin [Kribbella antibiotica]TDD61777.1 type VII secretion-associated serine protease mycosin [Kribbella antibiotica]